jgi:HK97 family phage prohead protease
MKVNLPITLTAADTQARTLTGRIVTWGEEGFTSAGKTIFSKDSITIPKNVKLLLEHDRTRPIGRLTKYEVTDTGIEASFKIAGTIAGDDSLLEAAEGLRDGFSVGIKLNSWDNKDGAMVISASEMIETSLVTDPAIDSARVTEVAATDNEVSGSNDSDVKTEGEVLVTETAQESATAEAVEAAKTEVTVSASAPVMYSTPRIEFTKEKYLENSIRAKLGDDDARQYLQAAASTTSNAGLVPTRQLTEVINPLANADRPFISAVSSGVLPDAGMTFEIPKISQVPTVAVTAEAGAPSDTDLENAYLSVAVQKFAGQQTFSTEILDRSSPAFFAELVKNMEYAYAKATNDRVSAVVVAAATDGGNRTMTAANLLDFVSDAAVSVYSGTLGFARNLVVSPEQWGAIMNLVDTTNRAIYTAANPVNNSGAVSTTSLQGNINGLNLYVSRSLSGVGDGTIVAINPESYTWYESPTFRLESNLINTGQINVGYFGYGAVATKVAAGAYKWMVA